MWKKLNRIFFSMQTMGVYVGVLAIAMAVATFIEDAQGTVAAKALVYNARWFEIVIFLTAVTILINIFKYKLYTWAKLPVFLFHLSFLVIILGAAVTRFTGNEGTIHIREGGTSNVISSFDTYFYAQVEDDGELSSIKQDVYLSARSKHQIRTKLRSINHSISFKSTDYTPGKMMSAQMGSSAGSSQPDAVKITVKADGITEDIMLRGFQGRDMQLYDFEVNGVKFTAGLGAFHSELPFSLQLNDFQIERYPGSNSPSSYASEVVLIDEMAGVRKPFRIFMNNILKYKGYRFYQSSYDPDELGTVLSVNDDAWGTLITYIGYALMVLSILASFFAPGSRFIGYIKASKKLPAMGVIVLLLILGSSLHAQNTKVSDLVKTEAREFGKIWVQGGNGRFEPVNTVSQKLVRKLMQKNTYGDMTADEFMLSILLDRQKWELVPIFDVKQSQIEQIIGTDKTKVSFAQFFDAQGQYVLTQAVNQAVSHRPDERTPFDKAVLKLDEQLNVFYMAASGKMLRIYPDVRNDHADWFDISATGKALSSQDSLFVTSAFPNYLLSVRTGKVADAIKWREAISSYQAINAADILPNQGQKDLEIIYSRLLVFEKLAIVYATIGLILLVIQFMALFKPKKWQLRVSSVFSVLLAVSFVIHTAGLLVRWYVSGHAPMSNGYESMIFVAWGTILAGLILHKRSKMAMALTAILAAMSLLVAHLSWMTPEITNLVPVLKSPWLTIHVAVVMTSYSFLGLGALVSLVVMVLYITKTRTNAKVVDANIDQLTRINNIVIIAGLFLITIGCFLGAIWANVSWGRYWGWDPKETWCLITILVYSFVTHMHHIKGLKGSFNFNLASLLAFSSVLMTYFGVNYFLGGMHSYAGGSTPTMPTAAYVSLIIIVIMVYWAYFNQAKFEKKGN